MKYFEIKKLSIGFGRPSLDDDFQFLDVLLLAKWDVAWTIIHITFLGFGFEICWNAEEAF